MTPGEVTQLGNRLRSAAQPAGSVDDILARVGPLVEIARRWLNPADPIRVEALDRLPGASPFPRAMWEAALEAMFGPITTDALRQFVHDELTDAHAFDVAAKRRLPQLIGQVLAGNVPAAAVQSIFCGVLAGSSQIVKTASEDRLFPVLLARSIAAVDATLGQRIAVAYWPGEYPSDESISPTRSPSSLRDCVSRLNEETASWQGSTLPGRECSAALAASADAIVVFGRAETIEAWRSLVEPKRGHELFLSSETVVPDTFRFPKEIARDPFSLRSPILIAHGPRTSLELIELSDDESAWTGLAENIAFDIALYDQQGCLSPQQVYLAAGRESATRFAARLGEALSRRAADWPMAPRSLADRLTVRRAREAHRIRRLVEPEHGPWLPSELTGPADRFDWTLLSTAGESMTIGPGMRTTYLTRVDSLRQAVEAIRPMVEAVQGVAVQSPDFAVIAKMLGDELHVPYVCRPGQLQRPPFGWANDGVRPLRGLMIEQ